MVPWRMPPRILFRRSLLHDSYRRPFGVDVMRHRPLQEIRPLQTFQRRVSACLAECKLALPLMNIMSIPRGRALELRWFTCSLVVFIYSAQFCQIGCGRRQVRHRDVAGSILEQLSAKPRAPGPQPPVASPGPKVSWRVRVQFASWHMCMCASLFPSLSRDR